MKVNWSCKFRKSDQAASKLMKEYENGQVTKMLYVYLE